MRCITAPYPKIQSKVNNQKAPSKAEVYLVPKLQFFTPFLRGGEKKKKLLRSHFYSWVLLKANWYHLRVPTHIRQLSTTVRFTREGKSDQAFPTSSGPSFHKLRVCAEQWKSCSPLDQSPVVYYGKYSGANAH